MEGNKRREVILAGTGGKGVLLAGQLLARAGLQVYAHVVWMPTYFAAMRSGACECTVVLSNREIASPVLSLSDVVVVFEPSQLAAFEVRVKPNGLLITESAGLPLVKRADIRISKVPAVEVAVGLGDSRASNMVLLGAYIASTGAVAPELVEAQIGERFAASVAGRLNIEAFYRGVSIGA
jgi:2-oxoglutarate ferredoxin oxidoreductase subunit gamma